MPGVDKIVGIDRSYAKRLAGQGIKSMQGLLARGNTRAGRRKLAEATGLSEKLILELVARADILQVHGVGPEYASLLNSVGVDTSEALASHEAEELAAQLAKTNQKKKLVRRLPAIEQIKGWILDALAIRSAPRGLAGEAVIEAPLPKRPRRSKARAPARRKKRRLYSVRY